MPLSLADVLSAQAGGGPVYEGGPDANVTPGGVLAALGLGGPSWLERAGKQGETDWAAYQRGGVPEMMANTQGTQDLAGGFGGTTTGIKGAAVKIGDKVFSGANHGEAYANAVKELGFDPWAGGANVAERRNLNGFLTDDGRFVDRAEASQIANAANQSYSTPDIPLMAHHLKANDPTIPQGIRAYHGSPYDFEKFDLSKIGTGEGAQAYGHGLYFAENPKVAEEYKKNVLNMPLITANNAKMSDLANVMDQYAIPGQYRKYQDPRGEQAAAEYDRLMSEKLDQGRVPGKMYEVNINAEPGQFLNWDAPIGQQPIASTVERTISRLPDTPQAQTLRNYLAASEKGTPGSAAYRELANRLGTEWSGASSALREAGIPGIRYLDQGSRTTSGGQLLGVEQTPQGWQAKIKVGNRGGVGFQDPTDIFTTSAPQATEQAARDWANAQINKGTSNYVVFNPDIVDILKKYGLAGLTMGGVLTAAGQEPAPSQ